jgi:hypothetical protein
MWHYWSRFTEMPIVFAQNLVEHGSLDSIAANLQHSTDAIGNWVSSVSPTTWMIVGIVIVVGLIVWSRR